MSRIFLILGIITVISSAGCMPAFTSCKGNLKIQKPLKNDSENIPSDRFIIVTFWDYPSINEKKGKIEINNIFFTKQNSMSLKFPTRIYTIIWTPVFGTQHLNPEPGVIIFNKNYFPSWNIGGTETNIRICCGSPKREHEFSIDLISDRTFFEDNANLFTKLFFENFLKQKESLISKMIECKELSVNEQYLVLNKLNEISQLLEIHPSAVK